MARLPRLSNCFSSIACPCSSREHGGVHQKHVVNGRRSLRGYGKPFPPPRRHHVHGNTPRDLIHRLEPSGFAKSWQPRDRVERMTGDSRMLRLHSHNSRSSPNNKALLPTNLSMGCSAAKMFVTAMMQHSWLQIRCCWAFPTAHRSGWASRGEFHATQQSSGLPFSISTSLTHWQHV